VFLQWSLSLRFPHQNPVHASLLPHTHYRRILGPVYDNGKGNCRILTDKEIYAVVKKPTITEKVRLYRLCWFGDVQRVEENRIPKRVLYMNLESTRPKVDQEIDGKMK
jgi:hypothetical protein